MSNASILSLAMPEIYDPPWMGRRGIMLKLHIYIFRLLSRSMKKRAHAENRISSLFVFSSNTACPRNLPDPLGGVVLYSSAKDPMISLSANRAVVPPVCRNTTVLPALTFPVLIWSSIPLNPLPEYTGSAKPPSVLASSLVAALACSLGRSYLRA